MDPGLIGIRIPRLEDVCVELADPVVSMNIKENNRIEEEPVVAEGNTYF